MEQDVTRWNVDDDLALRVILLLVDQQKNPVVRVPLVKTRVGRRNEEPELTTYPCFPRLGHTNAKDVNYRKMRQTKTLSQPQKICVSFSSHLSALFIRYSCCFTVVAQEDLQKRPRKMKAQISTKTLPGCLVFLSFQIAHTVGHTL